MWRVLPAAGEQAEVAVMGDVSALAAVPGRSQGHEVTFGAGAGGGLEIAGWHQVDLGAQDGLQVGLDPPQTEQAHVRWQVYEQVDIAVGPVLATGHTAKDRVPGRREPGSVR